MKLTAGESLQKLTDAQKLFVELFHHGSLTVEIYKPSVTDLQKPHDRDEVYVIISGHGEFISGGTHYTFQENDFFFVPAGTEHRFINFSPEFSTWVIFYGPKGGENQMTSNE